MLISPYSKQGNLHFCSQSLYYVTNLSLTFILAPEVPNISLNYRYPDIPPLVISLLSPCRRSKEADWSIHKRNSSTFLRVLIFVFTPLRHLIFVCSLLIFASRPLKCAYISFIFSHLISRNSAIQESLPSPDDKQEGHTNQSTTTILQEKMKIVYQVLKSCEIIMMKHYIHLTSKELSSWVRIRSRCLLPIQFLHRHILHSILRL